jgi:F-type H+-transporting ATPase subunit b
MNRRTVQALVVAALPLALAGVALATEEGHSGAHPHAAGIPVRPLFYATVNLLIFLWVLARFALPAVRNFVRDRRKQIVEALETAAAAKAEALKLQTEWETRLAQFEQSVQEMREQARRDAERERDRILASAHKTAEAIRKDAELAAAYELRRTQELLRAGLVQQALRLAEDTARTGLTAADQQRFVADFLDQVAQ